MLSVCLPAVSGSCPRALRGSTCLTELRAVEMAIPRRRRARVSRREASVSSVRFEVTPLVRGKRSRRCRLDDERHEAEAGERHQGDPADGLHGGGRRAEGGTDERRSDRREIATRVEAEPAPGPPEPRRKELRQVEAEGADDA